MIYTHNPTRTTHPPHTVPKAVSPESNAKADSGISSQASGSLIAAAKGRCLGVGALQKQKKNRVTVHDLILIILSFAKIKLT